MADKAHLLASALATAASTGVDPTGIVTLAFENRAELTFCDIVKNAAVDESCDDAGDGDDGESAGVAESVTEAAGGSGDDGEGGSVCDAEDAVDSIACGVEAAAGRVAVIAAVDVGRLVVDADELAKIRLGVLTVAIGLGVALGDAPRDSEDDGVPEPVGDAVPVNELVPEELAVSVALLDVEIGVAGAVGEFEGVAPFDSVADGVSDALGDVDGVTERDRVLVSEGDCVSVPLLVGDGVTGGVIVALLDALLVIELVPELLPVDEGDAPLDSDGVGDAVTVLLSDDVEDGVMDAEVELVGDEDDVGVTLAVALAVGDAESDAVEDADDVLVGVALLLADAPGESDCVFELLIVDEALTVLDALSLPVGVDDEVIDEVPEPVPELVGVGV
jgi:hypothetical protein